MKEVPFVARWCLVVRRVLPKKKKKKKKTKKKKTKKKVSHLICEAKSITKVISRRNRSHQFLITTKSLIHSLRHKILNLKRIGKERS